MTQESKDLLLKDLSSRLPYGVKLSIEIPDLHYHNIDILRAIDENHVNIVWLFSEIKPYLFPMSSMTQEQLQKSVFMKSKGKICEWIDWLNENHFDYRGLIEKKLAINCINLNIY